MFEINGTQILTPARHGWDRRQQLDINGSGIPVMSQYRSYRMAWPIMIPEEFAKVQFAFEQSQASGTVSITLPEYASGTYSTGTFSAVAYEPNYQQYFNETYRNVSMTFVKITA